MSTSQQLRARDVAAAYRLLEECRELGFDARVWQRHMLESISRLVGLRAAAGSEVTARGDELVTDWSAYVKAGYSESEMRRLNDLLTCSDYPRDEFCQRMACVFAMARTDELTRSRGQLIDDAHWARTDTSDAYRQMGIGDIVMSLVRIPNREPLLCVGWTRDGGSRAITLRETRILELFNRLLQPHLGRSLATCSDPGIAGLSPRRRQVLAHLLDGLAEKAIASRLKLSVPTVHEYVTALYRYFGVESRAELLALFLRRRHGPASEWMERYQVEE